MGSEMCIRDRFWIGKVELRVFASSRYVIRQDDFRECLAAAFIVINDARQRCLSADLFQRLVLHFERDACCCHGIVLVRNDRVNSKQAAGRRGFDRRRNGVGTRECVFDRSWIRFEIARGDVRVGFRS